MRFLAPDTRPAVLIEGVVATGTGDRWDEPRPQIAWRIISGEIPPA